MTATPDRELILSLIREADQDRARCYLDGLQRPHRGDAVEAWLKQQRDRYGWHGSNDATRWNTLDGLLDEYQLHADTGTPLDQHACENGTVDDCLGCFQAAKGGHR